MFTDRTNFTQFISRSAAAAMAFVAIVATQLMGQGTLDYGAAMTGAKIHYKGGRWAKAAGLFRTAIGLKPGNAEAHYWLGLTMAQIGKESLITAADEFDSSFTLDPQYPAKVAADEEHSYLVTRALSASAEAEMARAAGLAPEEAAVAFRRAIRFIRWALAINPNNPNYYMTLGNAYVGLDMPDSIRIVAEDLERKEKESAQAAFFMGIYYSKKEQPDSALINFALAGSRYEVAVRRLEERLDSLLKLRSPEKTREIANRLVALRNNQAALKSYIEDTLKSPRLLQQIAEVANNLFIDRFQIGLAFYRAGMACVQFGHTTSDTNEQKWYFARAETLFTHAAAADPENYDAWWYIGYANYRLMRDSATIAAFERAAAVSEARKDLVAVKDAELWMYLGTAEARLKQYDKAVVHLRRALKADPSRSDAYSNLAYVFKEMSRGDINSPWTDSAVQVLDERDRTGWRLSVWNVTDTEAIGPSKAESGKRYVVVEFTLFNRAPKADTADPGRLSVRGTDGSSYAVQLSALQSAEFGERGFVAPAVVDANGKLEGVAVFLIPKTVVAEELVYQLRSGSAVKAKTKG